MKNIPYEIINELTEHEENFRLVSPLLQACYNGLPAKYCKLCGVLFNKLIFNLFKGEKGRQKSIYEEKRIFTDVHLVVDDILEAYHSGKYTDGALYEKGKKKSTDRKNMHDSLKWLHNNNIFYHWKYKSNYMFFMDRDIGCWKYYNSKGVMLPKSLKKIITPVELQIDRMCRFDNLSSSRKTDRADIELSYGCYIEGMIKKMNPVVASSFPLFASFNNLFEYIQALKKHLDGIDGNEGYVPADNFYIKLPVDVRKWIAAKKAAADKEKRQKNMTKKKTDMEKEIAPDPSEANLCTNKGTRKKRQKRESIDKSYGNKNEVDELDFSREIEVNPFKNSKSLATYCQQYMSLHATTNLRLEGKGVASEYAGHILDNLIDINKSGNKEFLDAWLKNYLSKLTTSKMKNVEYTSLRALGKTLKEFNNIFYIP